jgi:hypothetical protein
MWTRPNASDTCIILQLLNTTLLVIARPAEEESTRIQCWSSYDHDHTTADISGPQKTFSNLKPLAFITEAMVTELL